MTFTLAATAETLEHRLRDNRLFDLPAAWADELIFPDYHGLSLVNVSQTIAHLLDADLPGAVTLDSAIWDGAAPAVDRVVLFLTDGLGYRWLQQAIADDPDIAASVADLTGGRGPLPITSVAPTTTATALTTLWTGRSPAAHGVLGLRLYLREVATLINILGYKPAASSAEGSLSAWGLLPEEFAPVPGLADLLARAGVPTHLLMPYHMMNTGLSRILHRGVLHRYTHQGYSDFWLRVGDVLAGTARQHCYVSIYWAAVDSIAHQYGAYNRYVRGEIRHQLSQLRDVLADPQNQDGRTLVLILADHGHADITHELDLSQERRARPIFDALRVGFGGENRLPFLYLREGTKTQVIETIEREFADCLTWVEADTALAAGLFGLDTPHSETPHRIGDLILIPRLGWKITDNFMRYDLASTHGCLSDWEMLVPLLWNII